MRPPEELARSAAQVVPPLEGLRNLDPGLLHLTLAFLGWVGSEMLPVVVAAATAAATRAEPFEITLGPPERFPRAGATRGIWLSVEEGREQLVELAEVVRTELGRHRLPFDARPFEPHLTVVRLRPGTPALEARRAVAAARPSRLRFRADSLEVMRSVLAPGGATYSTLASAPLTGAP